MPRFAIIVPAYNASSTIRETLDAVLAQVFPDWECVVTNDGSTDETGAIVKEYCLRDPRFVLVEQENQGVAAAHNAAVRASQAEFMVLCSADDYLFPHHLTAMDSLICENPDYGIYSSNGEYLFSTGDTRVVYSEPEWQDQRSLTLEQVLAVCFFSVGATYRRELFDAVGGLRPGVYVEDYDFWLRCMLAGARHLYTPQVLSAHRVSSTQASADVLRVYQSNIEVMQNLISSGIAHGEQVRLVESAIAIREQWIRDAQRSQARLQRLARIESTLARVVGERAARHASRITRAAARRILRRGNP